jgi:DNA-binding response OmpR family regulator
MGMTDKMILIVDDDADFRDSVTVVLESQGYKVEGAASAKEALASIAAAVPDLVVLDIMMECDSSGYEVNQAIKFREEFQLARDVPILMVSSIPLDPATRFDRAAEVEMITPDYYMTKPLNFKAFLEQVKILLETHQKRKAPEGQALAH